MFRPSSVILKKLELYHAEAAPVHRATPRSYVNLSPALFLTGGVGFDEAQVEHGAFRAPALPEPVRRDNTAHEFCLQMSYYEYF